MGSLRLRRQSMVHTLQMRLAVVTLFMGAAVLGELCEYKRPPCIGSEVGKDNAKFLEIATAKTVKECKQACEDKQTDGCEWWDFFTQHKTEITCTLLKEKCEFDNNENHSPDNQSGPRDCSTVKHCEEPTAKDVTWLCSSVDGSSTYGEGSECITECHGYKYKSTCEKNAKGEIDWKTTSDDDNDQSNIEAIGTPKSGECKCPVINLGDKHDPDREPGAIFTVIPDPETPLCTKDTDTKIKDGHVSLYCGGRLGVNIMCKQGGWFPHNSDKAWTKDQIAALPDQLWCFDKKKTECPTQS